MERNNRYGAHYSEPCPKLLSSHPYHRDCSGGPGRSRPAPYDAASGRVIRRELSHVLRVTLRSSLVQSVEREVVRRFLPDDVSAADAPMDCPAIECSGPEDG